MTGSSLRPVVVVALAAALLAYVGRAGSFEADDRASEPKTPAKVDPLRLFADWSTRPPAAILLISGEQDGYLQPCGCTDGQLGGLGRRFDLVEKLRARGWPVVPIDLGNLIKDPAGTRGGPEQEKVKYGIALKALAAMKYGAVALGPEDLKLGIVETLGQLLNLADPKFLAANLIPDEAFAGTVRPSILLKAGPVAVGVTAVMDPAAYAALADPDKAFLAIKAPDEVLPAVLARWKKEVAVRVLMVQGPIEEGRRLAAKFPGFDLVVTNSKFDDPDERPESLNGGKTLLINVGRKGKYAGVVGLFPGSTPVVRYKRQPLDGKNFRESETIRALIDDEFQANLKAMRIVETYPRKANVAYPSGATYAGAESCKECHPNTFAKWASTKHARAFDDLQRPRRNRENDAECISCHTTGFGYNSGWVSAQATPQLKGNQCENCHGPGSLHNAEPDNLAYRKPMALNAEAADRGNFCISCHNEDNDPKFSFASRHAQIFHKGLDSYDDAKVHRKRPDKSAK